MNIDYQLNQIASLPKFLMFSSSFVEEYFERLFEFNERAR